jgi:hypothetical protein
MQCSIAMFYCSANVSLTSATSLSCKIKLATLVSLAVYYVTQLEPAKKKKNAASPPHTPYPAAVFF